MWRRFHLKHDTQHLPLWHFFEGRKVSGSIRAHFRPTKEEIIDDNLFNDLMCFIQYLKRESRERSSILSNNGGRKQYNTSSPVNFSLARGVPQGSILGRVINKSETSFPTPPTFCIYPWFIGPHQSSIVIPVRIKPLGSAWIFLRPYCRIYNNNI